MTGDRGAGLSALPTGGVGFAGRHIFEARLDNGYTVAIESRLEPATPEAFSGFSPLSIDKTHLAWRFQPRSPAAGAREYRDSLPANGVRT
jgi:hypothetical protein